MTAEQWARLSQDVDCGLRRGAWYRAETVSPSEVLLLVGGKRRSFARGTMEVSPVPPSRWTVVSGLSNSRVIPIRWSKGYAVCPACRMRQLPLGRPQALRCERCNGLFEVAWDEAYLSGGHRH
jgi:hypothetical protein